jgi:hypothetical protein
MVSTKKCLGSARLRQICPGDQEEDDHMTKRGNVLARS